MPSLVVIGKQIKEKQMKGRGGGGGTMCPPAYMVPKDPTLNRVKGPNADLLFLIKQRGGYLNNESL